MIYNLQTVYTLCLTAKGYVYVHQTMEMYDSDMSVDVSQTPHSKSVNKGSIHDEALGKLLPGYFLTPCPLFLAGCRVFMQSRCFLQILYIYIYIICVSDISGTVFIFEDLILVKC